ncbi:NosD domain-containing protein [Phenylobacterium sp.]|uniref:NosD domain-containing protein n=1 Tax=Phenylobacterium sp. TaxID=1871053 RepID=UPI00289BBDC5|nr:right-handed parallel beta-helix repeat-containing protein [Phenylobacterium sp.]
MSIAATCATIVTALASAQGGETITLRGDCGAIAVTRTYPKLVTVNAEGASVRGLTITGGNLAWNGGTLSAPKGAHARAGDGYGVLIRNASDVTITGVVVTDAKKGMVVDGARGVTIADSRFVRYGEDGVIASDTRGLTIVRNRFADQIGKPTECDVGGKISYGLSRKDCIATKGAWQDGYHNDAVQMRNGVVDALIAHNQVEGETQGITQMDKTGDAPLEKIRIESNTLRTDGYHPITLGTCVSCSIRLNVVRRAPGSTKKAVIRAQGDTMVCGNTVPDMPSTGGPRCKDGASGN